MSEPKIVNMEKVLEQDIADFQEAAIKREEEIASTIGQKFD